VLEEEMTTAELLEQWRETVRASELAARLAKIAAESVERSRKGAVAAEELAQLAERAAAAANEQPRRRDARLMPPLSSPAKTSRIRRRTRPHSRLRKALRRGRAGSITKPKKTLGTGWAGTGPSPRCDLS
jgi:hypothetical protein